MTQRHVSHCGMGKIFAKACVTKMPISKGVSEPKVAQTFHAASQREQFPIQVANGRRTQLFLPL
jgi:hypothetical protein